MWNKCSGKTTSFTKKSHHALALPGLVQYTLCLSYDFPSSVLYCDGGISQNASGSNLAVSVRRSGDCEPVEGFVKICRVKEKMRESRRGARARARWRVWYQVNGMIMLQKAICHVRYINILTCPRGFQDKPPYLVLFSLYLSLFRELRDEVNFKKVTILSLKTRSMLECWYIERGEKKKKTLQKTHKSLRQTVGKVFESCRKKSNDFFLCLHCLVLWKLRNLETWVNFRIAF